MNDSITLKRVSKYSISKNHKLFYFCEEETFYAKNLKNLDNEEKYLVEDFWGNKQDVRNIDVILTENQFKLAKAYDSVEQYLEECNKNGWEFSIPKVLIFSKQRSNRNTINTRITSE